MRSGQLAARLCAAFAPLVVLALAGCAAGSRPASPEAVRWAASWGSAQAVPWNEYVLPDEQWTDTSLRQVVVMSLSAKRLRVRVSNVHGTAALQISGASVGRAVKPGKPDVEPQSLRILTFDG